MQTNRRYLSILFFLGYSFCLRKNYIFREELEEWYHLHKCTHLSQMKNISTDSIISLFYLQEILYSPYSGRLFGMLLPPQITRKREHKKRPPAFASDMEKRDELILSFLPKINGIFKQEDDFTDKHLPCIQLQESNSDSLQPDIKRQEPLLNEEKDIILTGAIPGENIPTEDILGDESLTINQLNEALNEIKQSSFSLSLEKSSLQVWPCNKYNNFLFELNNKNPRQMAPLDLEQDENFCCLNIIFQLMLADINFGAFLISNTTQLVVSSNLGLLQLLYDFIQSENTGCLQKNIQVFFRALHDLFAGDAESLKSNYSIGIFDWFTERLNNETAKLPADKNSSHNYSKIRFKRALEVHNSLYDLETLLQSKPESPTISEQALKIRNFVPFCTKEHHFISLNRPVSSLQEGLNVYFERVYKDYQIQMKKEALALQNNGIQDIKLKYIVELPQIIIIRCCYDKSEEALHFFEDQIITESGKMIQLVQEEQIENELNAESIAVAKTSYSNQTRSHDTVEEKMEEAEHEDLNSLINQFQKIENEIEQAKKLLGTREIAKYVEVTQQILKAVIKKGDELSESIVERNSKLNEIIDLQEQISDQQNSQAELVKKNEELRKLHAKAIEDKNKLDNLIEKTIKVVDKLSADYEKHESAAIIFDAKNINEWFLKMKRFYNERMIAESDQNMKSFIGSFLNADYLKNSSKERSLCLHKKNKGGVPLSYEPLNTKERDYRIHTNVNITLDVNSCNYQIKGVISQEESDDSTGHSECIILQNNKYYAMRHTGTTEAVVDEGVLQCNKKPVRIILQRVDD
ncbi:hypothetical protein ENBRE01_1699 [Enteropsectra breve]|nr:hypothetical protein ENBRE01_1520 [Enteropsectra breve]KAI5150771.1 hypothetical protein ENBRE01_1699 [Enteropsectra breve]